MPPPPHSSYADASSSDRRRDRRQPVKLVADYRRPGRPSFKVEIVDLSETGCRIASLHKAHVGSQIWLTVPGLSPIEAVVKWATPFAFGCAWAKPLHISLVDHIAAQFTAAR